MTRKVLLLAAITLLGLTVQANAQTRSPRVGFPAMTVGNPIIQHHHGAIQSSPKGVVKGDCGCGPIKSAPCATCKPCCPPIIPCLLNKFDQFLHCVLPSCRFGCGGCGLCGGHGYYKGCGPAGPAGVIVEQGTVIERAAPQAAPADARQTYYQRRGTLQPRYQASGSRVVRPVPARRTATPKPARKPAPKTHTASTGLQRIDSQRVDLKPAPSNVRVASFQQATKAPEKKRIPNPLRR